MGRMMGEILPPMTARSVSQARLVSRPAAERFHTQVDWLNSWHSFSFGSHRDSAWMGFGPLRVINDDTIAAGQGFGMHPHRDMEIITVMVEGQLNHRDSMGHSAVLQAGEVQRMSAGRGIVHSEMNGGDQPCRLLQIWIEPNATGLSPEYEQKPFPLAAGGWTALIDPDASGVAMAIHHPTRLWRAQLAPGQTLAPPEPAGAMGWIQMVTGAVHLQGMVMGQGDGLGFQGGPEAPPFTALTAGPAGADLLWFALA
jgi:redox-sensitive bicupin YhaK (pirin superfamily)